MLQALPISSSLTCPFYYSRRRVIPDPNSVSICRSSLKWFIVFRSRQATFSLRWSVLRRVAFLLCTLSEWRVVISIYNSNSESTRWQSWLRRFATSRKVAGSSPRDVITFFQCTSSLQSNWARGLLSI
jgi:hypothetical protein